MATSALLRMALVSAGALLVACLGSARPGRAGEPTPVAGKALVFERSVLPIFAAHCLKCHGEEARKAGLDLRTPALILKGGDSGPALVKGTAGKSLLFEHVSNGTMPPGKATKLSEAQVAVIRDWINAGAPADQPDKAVTVTLVSDKDRQFWSFKNPVRPPVPAVKQVDRVRTPIDAFLLSKLEAKGLTFTADADALTLLRRVTFDLTGLPPTPAEMDAFLADDRPGAYERLIERLLASPQYGERWGRHWLDAAGYADSIGGDNDPGQMFPREGMWRYRDYVVRSLNADKPYDRFLLEQLAGDELVAWRSAATFGPEVREHLIATGLLRCCVDHTYENELNRPFERYQVLHDTIENLTSNLLGLTVGCARCHDHKFDPIPQEDYYRLLACLKPTYNPEAWVQPQNRYVEDRAPGEQEQVDRHNAPLDRQAADLQRQADEVRAAARKRAFEAKLAALPEVLRADTAAAVRTEPAKRTEVQKYLADKLGPLLNVTADDVTRALGAEEKAKVEGLDKHTAALKGQRRSLGRIQAAYETGPAPATRLLRRGNHLTPGRQVSAGFFSVLTDPTMSNDIPPASPADQSSGRRTAWARWLIRPDHALTARVFVNRVWQHHFGEGLVATPDNLGKLGARPAHAELLDWLAVEFVERGWSIKELHRLIVTSTGYRQASCRDGPETPDPEVVDPGNQLLWRMRLRRLESEAIRDAVLAVSGRLARSMGGPPVPIEPKNDGTVVIAAKGLPTPAAAARRTLYLTARRNYNLTILNVFDQPVMATNCTRRVASAVPLQSLTMLNDAFLLEQADEFAGRVAQTAGPDPARRVETAFRLAFGRPPNARETAASLALLDDLARRYGGQKAPPGRAEGQALARLCHMLLCANEFLYVG